MHEAEFQQHLLVAFWENNFVKLQGSHCFTNTLITRFITVSTFIRLTFSRTCYHVWVHGRVLHQKPVFKYFSNFLKPTIWPGMLKICFYSLHKYLTICSHLQHSAIQWLLLTHGAHVWKCAPLYPYRIIIASLPSLWWLVFHITVWPFRTTTSALFLFRQHIIQTSYFIPHVSWPLQFSMKIKLSKVLEAWKGSGHSLLLLIISTFSIWEIRATHFHAG